MARIANDNTDKQDPIVADDNIIQPFQIEISGLRGRIVRVGSVLNAILAAHDYPMPVAHLLAETVALSLSLSSMLKFEGVFTLQTSGDGPVRTMVSDVTSAGGVRGYVGFDAAALAALPAGAGQYGGMALHDLTGKGYLAFTVDQGEFAERYQGIVALEGDTLSDVVQHYFDQSEQIGTCLKVAAAYDATHGWRAGALMLQRMPDPSEAMANKAEHVIALHPERTDEQREDWNRAAVLLQSATPAELTSETLHSHALLFRLFHEEGVRIFDPQTIFKACRCTTERVQRVLETLSLDDRMHAAIDGVIEMTCEFCSKSYLFAPDPVAFLGEAAQTKVN